MLFDLPCGLSGKPGFKTNQVKGKKKKTDASGKVVLAL